MPEELLAKGVLIMASDSSALSQEAQIRCGSQTRVKYFDDF